VKTVIQELKQKIGAIIQSFKTLDRKSKKRIGAIILGISVIITVIMFICGYNSYIRSKNALQSQKLQVENTISDTMRLIERLTENAKNYSSEEKELTQKIDKALDVLQEAIDSEDMALMLQENQNLEQVLEDVVSSLDKQADHLYEVYDNIACEISTGQNCIRQEVRKYNKKVEAYNNAIESWPLVIYAKLFGIKSENGFDLNKYFASNN
jgi:LemA protein